MTRRESARRMLGEFTVIVLGVLVALAVDEWRQGIDEQQDADSYLEALVDDLVSDSVLFAAANTAVLRQIEGAQYLDDLLATPHQVADSTRVGRAVAALALVDIQVTARVMSFQTLLSSGRLELLSPRLRQEVGAYHEQVTRDQATVRDLQESPLVAPPTVVINSGYIDAAIQTWARLREGSRTRLEIDADSFIAAIRADTPTSRAWLRRRLYASARAAGRLLRMQSLNVSLLELARAETK